MNLDKFNWRLFVRNRQFLLYSIGISLLSIIIVWQAAIPLVNSMLAVNSELSKQRIMVAQLGQKAARLRELQSQDIVVSQDLVNAVLPSKKPVLELLTGLNLVAGRAGVSFRDFTVSPGQIASTSAETSAQAQTRRTTKDSGPYDALLVELTAEGSFDQIQTFLGEVELLAPFTTVTDLSLNIRRSRSGIVDADDFVSAEMMLSTNYYTQSLKAALTSPLPVITTKHEDVLSQLESFTFPSSQQQQQVVDQGVFDLFGISTDQLLEEVE
jgi:hypothetical protein